MICDLGYILARLQTGPPPNTQLLRYYVLCKCTPSPPVDRTSKQITNTIPPGAKTNESLVLFELMALGALHRVLGVLHRVLEVLHRVLGYYTGY